MTRAIALMALALAACDPQMPANDAWGATPVGVKHVSSKGAPLSIHPKFGGVEGASLGANGSTGTRTREAAVNGAQTTDSNGCEGKPDGAAVCAESSIHVCVAGVEYVLDCDKFAQNDGWDGGACVQTDVATDCFGCAASGSTSNRSCCDVQKASACCEEKSGECWKP